MRISDRGLEHITASEGCRLEAYPDPGTAPPHGNGEPWTIGVGHTGGVKPGDTCTMEQAMAWLRSDVAWAEAAVNRRITVPLAQSQFDALVSFVFNVGESQFGTSTLLRLLNAGDYRGAAAQFDRWNLAGGRVMPGLVRRRAEERAMFEEGIGREAA